MSLEKALQQSYGSTRRAEKFYNTQMIDFLNEEMITFIELQEMMFISTADRAGNCDSSIRIGEAGYIKVIDSKTLAYPEYRGNGVYASLGNILENPHIGILMVDFYKTTVGLHVNGKASIVDELGSYEDPRAERWVKIDVEEAYIQCSKHIPLLARQDKNIVWNTDDEKLKGGDFFSVRKKKALDIGRE